MFRSLRLPLAVALLLAFALSGCVVLKAKPLSPGQMQKATGVNPASGKVKHK